jgi:hypothetical protein
MCGAARLGSRFRGNDGMGHHFRRLVLLRYRKCSFIPHRNEGETDDQDWDSDGCGDCHGNQHDGGTGPGRFAAAVNAKDVDAIMKVYVPDESLLVFDVVPPRQYTGAMAYRKDWEGFLALFKGSPKLDITELNVVAVGPVGYGPSV